MVCGLITSLHHPDSVKAGCLYGAVAQQRVFGGGGGGGGQRD